VTIFSFLRNLIFSRFSFFASSACQVSDSLAAHHATFFLPKNFFFTVVTSPPRNSFMCLIERTTIQVQFGINWVDNIYRRAAGCWLNCLNQQCVSFHMTFQLAKIMSCRPIDVVSVIRKSFPPPNEQHHHHHALPARRNQFVVSKQVLRFVLCLVL